MKHAWRTGLLLLLSGLTCAGETPSRGSLLVASRSVKDPELAGAVILLLRSDANGAIGLILNQPSPVPVSTLFPQSTPRTIFKGGPVRMGINGLIREKGPGRSLVFGDVYLVSDKAEIKALATRNKPDIPLRVYVGLCGWTAGQLAGELQRGVWSVRRPSAALVFDPRPESVWSKLNR